MLALALASTLIAAAPVQIAPGTYTYTATMAGANIGSSTLTVSNANGTTTIDESAAGSVGGAGAKANATLTLAPDLSPTTYQLTGVSNGSPVKDAVTIADAKANVTNVHGKTSSVDLLGSTKHFVVLDLGVFAGFLPLPAQMRAWSDATVLAVIPSIGQSVALVPAGPSTPPPARPSKVPATDQSLSFEGQAPFTIWYDPTTNVPDEIDVTSQGIVVTRQR
jgi:hypothetical protein